MAAGDTAAATAHLAAQVACFNAMYRPNRIRSSGTSVNDPTFATALAATNAAVTASASGSASLVTTQLAIINKNKVLYGPTTLSNIMRRRYLRIVAGQHKVAARIHSIAP